MEAWLHVGYNYLHLLTLTFAYFINKKKQPTNNVNALYWLFSRFELLMGLEPTTY